MSQETKEKIRQPLKRQSVETVNGAVDRQFNVPSGAAGTRALIGVGASRQLSWWSWLKTVKIVV